MNCNNCQSDKIFYDDTFCHEVCHDCGTVYTDTFKLTYNSNNNHSVLTTRNMYNRIRNFQKILRQLQGTHLLTPEVIALFDPEKKIEIKAIRKIMRKHHLSQRLFHSIMKQIYNTPFLTLTCKQRDAVLTEYRKIQKAFRCKMHGRHNMFYYKFLMKYILKKLEITTFDPRLINQNINNFEMENWKLMKILDLS